MEIIILNQFLRRTLTSVLKRFLLNMIVIQFLLKALNLILL